ncbi:hypothetical protein TNCV_2095751 [Trichonephila clavipes]|nr:hypothetical protein TNCV_2095751 [Trichonephila clavipes]
MFTAPRNRAILIPCPSSVTNRDSAQLLRVFVWKEFRKRYNFAKRDTDRFLGTVVSDAECCAIGQERWEAPDPLPAVLSQNWGGTEINRTVTCMVLNAMANDSHTSSPIP